jgi:hypothetical protein
MTNRENWSDVVEEQIQLALMVVICNWLRSQATFSPLSGERSRKQTSDAGESEKAVFATTTSC